MRGKLVIPNDYSHILLTNRAYDAQAVRRIQEEQNNAERIPPPVLIASPRLTGYLVIDGVHRLVATASRGKSIWTLLLCPTAHTEVSELVQNELIAENRPLRLFLAGLPFKELVNVAEEAHKRTGKQNLQTYIRQHQF